MQLVIIKYLKHSLHIFFLFKPIKRFLLNKSTADYTITADSSPFIYCLAFLDTYTIYLDTYMFTRLNLARETDTAE